MPARFPKRRADGSFKVVALINEVTATEAAVREWCAGWAVTNATWTRVWRTGGRDEIESLTLKDEFSRSPSFLSLVGDELHVEFEGLGTAKLWKDFLVKFTVDFLASHPGARLTRFESV